MEDEYCKLSHRSTQVIDCYQDHTIAVPDFGPKIAHTAAAFCVARQIR